MPRIYPPAVESLRTVVWSTALGRVATCTHDGNRFTLIVEHQNTPVTTFHRHPYQVTDEALPAIGQLRRVSDQLNRLRAQTLAPVEFESAGK